MGVSGFALPRRLLAGWFFLALGLLRMFTAGQYQRVAAQTTPEVFMVLELFLLAIALVITCKACARPACPKDDACDDRKDL
jgi:hypothetical protein